MIIRKKFLYITLLCGLLTSCSTKQNTASTRWWQSFVTRYNVFYNAKVAYGNGEEAQRNGLRENYTEPLPLYSVGYEKMRSLGKNDFQTAITKSEKAIQLHSIKKRPVVNRNRTTTPKQKAYLSRKEFNPYLKHAWLLMGKAQFQQGDFVAAASTFAYITRFYAPEPEVVVEARLWLARCYGELDWFYDAEDALRRAEREGIPRRLEHERNLTTAGYLLRQSRSEEAVPYLTLVAKKERNSFRKSRYYYLLGQTLMSLDRKAEAYKALQKCIDQNPPFETAFQARILQTEALTTPQSATKMISRLKRMAKDDRNKDHLDRVYYAMGNIHLARRDTAAAFEAYETGRYRATQATPDKGILLLRLGELYWQQRRFDKAQPCYTEAIGLLDKERKDYKELTRRSSILDQLVPHTSAVFQQDSLLTLVKMSEEDRNRVIDQAIAEYKRKEAEERRYRADSASRAMAEANGDRRNDGGMDAPTPRTNNTDRSWYFYNPQLVQQGKQSFAKQWGNRKNTDDWRRSNRTIVATASDEGYDYAAEDSIRALIDARRDSLTSAGLSVSEVDQQLRTYSEQLARGESGASASLDGGKAPNEAAQDPRQREYYLAQLPFSKEEQEEAHKIIQEGLMEAGLIEKDKLEDLPLAHETFRRLVRSYPSYERLDEAYYHLFLLAKRRGRTSEAEQYRQTLATYYPNYPMTSVVNDPEFERKSRFSRELEDSLYSATYYAYIAGDRATVATNFEQSTRSYPTGLNRPKFMLVHALSQIGTAPRDTLVKAFRAIATEYPKSDVSEMAGMIVRGLESGRTIRGGGLNLGSLWSRRLSETTAENAAAGESRQLSDEKDIPFVFLVAYPTDSLSDDRLLYELARFNFSAFVSRGFDIAKERGKEVTQFRVSGFVSFDDVHYYAQRLFRDASLSAMLRQTRIELVSETNLKLLGTLYSFDEYRAFYDKHFVPLDINPELPLEFEPHEDEPTQIYEDEVPSTPTNPQRDRKKEEEDEDYYYYDE